MRWYVTKDKADGPWVIRGEKNNKRLAVKKYRQIRDDKAALDALVKRLNAPTDAKETVSFRHAFINDSLLEEYRSYLETKVTGAGLVTTEIGYLKNYFLHYFITLHNIIDPSRWIEHEAKWVSYILNDPQGPEQISDKLKGIKAETTKRKVISAANRFMTWLHKKRPEEIPVAQFDTIAKPKFDSIKERRRLDEETNEHVYIPKEDLKILLESLPANLAPFVHLMERYGLRRNEALGVKPGDVKKNYLRIERQLRLAGKHSPSEEKDAPPKNRKWAPPKGKKAREVPHWVSNTNPIDTYRWVSEAQKHIVSPRELSKRFSDYVAKLGLEYTFHDLRHTWTTEAIKKVGDPHPFPDERKRKDMSPNIQARDIQLAAGHKNLSTTMGYVHDQEGDGGDEFVPNDAA